MGNLLNRDEVSCRRFLDALEELPLSGNTRKSAEEWRAELPGAEEKHAGGCEACRKAVEGFGERGNALGGMMGPKEGRWVATAGRGAITGRGGGGGGDGRGA